jgi:hypothetical protein
VSDTLCYGNVFGALDKVSRMLGRTVNPTVYSNAEFSKRTKRDTYRLTRRRAAATDDWNATQVYETQTSGWRVIHSHWSEVKERQQ